MTPRTAVQSVHPSSFLIPLPLILPNSDARKTGASCWRWFRPAGEVSKAANSEDRLGYFKIKPGEVANSIFSHSYIILGSLKAPKLDLLYCVCICVKVELQLYFNTKYLELIFLHANLMLLSKGILLREFSMRISSKAPTG